MMTSVKGRCVVGTSPGRRKYGGWVVDVMCVATVDSRGTCYGLGAGASVPLPPTGPDPATGGMKRGMYPVREHTRVSMYHVQYTEGMRGAV